MKRLSLFFVVVVLALLSSVGVVSANTVVVANLGPVNIPSGFGLQGCSIESQVFVNIVQEDPNGQRVVFRINGGNCNGRILGRTSGASDDGIATGGFVLNGVVYATGVFTGTSKGDAFWTPRFNDSSVKLMNSGNYNFNSNLYRAIQVGKRVHIERNIALAGLGDFDNNIANDGWASVGRTNGAGNDGQLLSMFVINDVPFAVINYFTNQGGRRCILVTPGTLDVVRKGQTRVMLNNGRFADPYVGPGCTL